MKNTLMDLNDKLFSVLDQLDEIDEASDPKVSGMVFKKAKAMSDVSKVIVANANVALAAERLRMDATSEKLDYSEDRVKLPGFFRNRETVEEKKNRILGGLND